MLNESKILLLSSVKKPKFIFVPSFLISGPEDMECKGEQQTWAQGDGGLTMQSESRAMCGADMFPVMV